LVKFGLSKVREVQQICSSLKGLEITFFSDFKKVQRQQQQQPEGMENKIGL